MKIGFVGLGAMGSHMAVNLVRAGYGVSGFDQREAAVSELAAAGGLAASSSADAAGGSDVLLLMVVNAAQAESILFGDGALDSLKPDGVVMLMATCPPEEVRNLAERVMATERGFVDAPVSGGVVGAEAATLSIMFSGADAAVEKVRPLMEALGDKLFHMGDRPGLGATAKTINQLLCGVHIAAAAEAMALAEKAGVPTDTMLEIVSGSAASSWMLRDRGARMLQEDPVVTSAVDIFVKDLGIVLAAGVSNRAALPLATAAHQMFVAASGQGRGKEDDSKVIEVYRRL